MDIAPRLTPCLQPRGFRTILAPLLVVAGVAVLHGPGAWAGAEPPVRCPGDTTLEMRYCAGQALDQSDRQLQRRLSHRLFRQWQEATRAVCAQAYAPYRDGTIYVQLVVGCDDQLNRRLLQEFQSLDQR